MNTKEIFPIRLLELRKSKGISRQKAADDLGISRATLEYYEKGKRCPSVNVIDSLAEYYGVSVDYLFGRTQVEKADSNLQATSRYTHLSEGAIEKLASCNNAFPNDIAFWEILNRFISDNTIIKFVSEIKHYIAINTKLEKLQKQVAELFDNKERLSEEIEEVSEQYFALSEEVKVNKMEASVSLFSIQEDISNFVKGCCKDSRK